MEPESLIVIDYSGTLSLEAPQFARPDHLLRQLDECGLSALGIDRPAVFWEEIVNPTWERGSTTAVGYASLLESRIREWRAGRGAGRTDDKAIAAAVALFVARYLAHSVIDPRWEPLLRWLTRVAGVLTVIATDHYAEATDAIIAHLKDRQVEGTALRDLMRQGWRKASAVIANSADMGAHKADRMFWDRVGACLPLQAVRRVLVVDDFGAHEQTGDAYGVPSRVAARHEKMAETLRSVFHVPVDVIDFIAVDAASGGMDQEPFDALIGRTIAAIRDYLKESHEPLQCRPDQ